LPKGWVWGGKIKPESQEGGGRGAIKEPQGGKPNKKLQNAETGSRGRGASTVLTEEKKKGPGQGREAKI